MNITFADAIVAAFEVSAANPGAHVDAFVTVRVNDLHAAVAQATMIAKSDGDSLLAMPTEKGIDLIACDPQGRHVWKLSIEEA